MSVLCVMRWKPEQGSEWATFALAFRYLQTPKDQHLISRAANMRLLSRALAFAVLVAGAILPNASDAQVVPAIKGGGSQINVYGLYVPVKTDFNSTLDYPPAQSSAQPTSSMPMAGTRGFPSALISAWGGSCLASRRSGRASPTAPATTGSQRTFDVWPRTSLHL